MSIKWILRITCLMQIASIGILFAFEAVRMKDMGVGETAIGIILGVGSGIFILSSLFWGRLADRHHWHRKIAIWGSVVFVFLLFYFSICSSVWEFALYALIKAIISPMVFGMMPALAVSSFGHGSQGRDFGVYRAFGSLGFIVGGMVLPLIFKKIDTVAQVGALIILASCFLLFQLREPETKQAPAQPLTIGALKPAIKLFLITYFFIAFSEPAMGGFYSAYARELGGSTQLLGLLFGFAGFMALISLPLMGKWMDHSNPVFIISIAFLAQPVRIFVTAFILSPEMLWVPLLLHGVCWGGVEVAAIVYLSSLAEKGQKATVLSYYMAMRMLGNFIGASLTGYLAENSGYGMMFKTISIVALFGALFYILGSYKLNRRPSLTPT